MQDGGSDSSSNGGRANRSNPASDYSEGASHVLAIIHQILNHHRALEHRWHLKKIKLHQRLALRLFQEDVKQVRVCFIAILRKIHLISFFVLDGSVFLRTSLYRILSKSKIVPVNRKMDYLVGFNLQF